MENNLDLKQIVMDLKEAERTLFLESPKNLATNLNRVLALKEKYSETINKLQ